MIKALLSAKEISINDLAKKTGMCYINTYYVVKSLEIDWGLIEVYKPKKRNFKVRLTTKGWAMEDFLYKNFKEYVGEMNGIVRR